MFLCVQQNVGAVLEYFMRDPRRSYWGSHWGRWERQLIRECQELEPNILISHYFKNQPSIEAFLFFYINNTILFLCICSQYLSPQASVTWFTIQIRTSVAEVCCS